MPAVDFGAGASETIGGAGPIGGAGGIAEGATDATWERAYEMCSDLEAARRLTGLDIVDELGRGGTAAVYRVRSDDGAHYAVKVLDKGITRVGNRSDRGEAELLREARVMGALRHAGICTFLALQLGEMGTPYLAMEWIEGCGLLEFWSRKDFTSAERFDVFSQVCEAVAYMHDRRYIHGDIRSDNVVVTSDGRRPIAKLIDFGSSFRVDMSPGRSRRLPKWGAAEVARPEGGLHRCVRVAGIGDAAGLASILRTLLRIERNEHGNTSQAERLGRRFAPAVSGVDLDLGHLTVMSPCTLARKSRVALREAMADGPEGTRAGAG